MAEPIKIKIIVPPGLTPEEEERYIQQETNKRLQPQIGTIPAALAGLTQGLTMDWGDEIAGKLSSVFTGQKADEAQAERRALYEAAEKQHPFAYNAAYLAGSLAPSLVVKNPTPLASTFGKLLPSFAKNVVGESAIQGSIAGAGMAENDDRIKGGLYGGLLGGLLGSGLKGAKTVAENIGDFYRNTLHPNAAANILSEAVEESPGGFNAVRDAIREASQSQQPFTLADATPPGSRVRGILEGALNRPNDTNARQKVLQFLYERASDARERVINKLDEILGQSPDPYAAQGAIKEEIENSLRPVFQKVLEKQGDNIISDPEVLSRLRAPAAEKALRKAREIMENYGEPFGVIKSNDGTLQGITLRTFDTVRKVLGDAAYQNLNLENSSSALKSETVALRKLLGDLMDSVRNQFPDYAKALDAYSNIFRLRDAVEVGVAAASKTGKQALQAFEKMETEAEKKSFAVGYFGRKLEKASGQKNPGAELYGSPIARETTNTILSALQNKETVDEFGRFLTRERDIVGMPSEMLGGSPTARRFVLSNLFRFTTPRGIIGALEDKTVRNQSDKLINMGLLSDPDSALRQLEAAAREKARISASRESRNYLVSPLSRLGVSVIEKEGKR